MTDYDDEPLRPWGWGVCADCGQDADEADYDEATRITLCPSCKRKREQGEAMARNEVLARR